MKKIGLSGKNWMLLGSNPQKDDPAGIELPAGDSRDWIRTQIPGDVNDTLLKNGKIPDPFIDENAKQCYWITSKAYPLPDGLALLTSTTITKACYQWRKPLAFIRAMR